MRFLQAIYRLVIIGVCGIILPAPIYASNLMDIYREALEQDTQYKSARAAYVAAQEKTIQGRAGLLPNVTLTGHVRRLYINTTFGPEQIIPQRGAVLSATQPLIRVESLIIYAQSKIEVAQADSQFVVAAQDMILRVAQAYFDVLSAQVDVEVAESQKAAILQQLEQAKRNFEVGVATIVDTNEAQARFDLTISQEIAARNVLEINKRTLQSIINRFPDDLVNAREINTELTSLAYVSMEEWVTVAEAKNFLLKIQRADFEIAKKEVMRTQSLHFPTVDFFAEYSDQVGIGGAFTGRGIDLTSKAVGIQINVPLFEGFATQSRVREALANRDRARHDLETTQRNTTLQTRQQYLNVTNGIALIKALQQALISSQIQLESTMLGQEVGVRIEVDVLNAQQQMYAARRDLIKAYYDYLMARLRLKAEAGELDEDTLQEINGLL